MLPLLLADPGPACADDDPQALMQLLAGADEQIVTTSRSPRPTSKIAENVTVITAEEIKLLNAHTVAEVLNTVAGIQCDYLRTPGSFSYFNIQGANYGTVLVLIDGIRQNDFDQMIARPHMVPVQQIERIEIIKGAASTAWGPALGGVVNIITKEPAHDRQISGMISGSIGSAFTADSRGEVSGTLDKFGYYLSAGNLHSDGLAANNGINQNNAFGKLAYALPANGAATLILSYLDGWGGMDEGNTVRWGFVHDNLEPRASFGYLRVYQPLGNKLTLEVDGFFTDFDNHTKLGGLDGQGAVTFFNDYNIKEWSRGASTRLIWGDRQMNLTMGAEYAHDRAYQNDALSPVPPMTNRSWDRGAIYANGTYTLGPLTILPGIRYDHTGLADSTASGPPGNWRRARFCGSTAATGTPCRLPVRTTRRRTSRMSGRYRGAWKPERSRFSGSREPTFTTV